eukprot:747680-Hanusia_phi.AAC.7
MAGKRKRREEEEEEEEGRGKGTRGKDDKLKVKPERRASQEKVERSQAVKLNPIEEREILCFLTSNRPLDQKIQASQSAMKHFMHMQAEEARGSKVSLEADRGSDKVLDAVCKPVVIHLAHDSRRSSCSSRTFSFDLQPFKKILEERGPMKVLPT